MVEEFYKFPSTPHLLSMGSEIPRDDKLMSPDEIRHFLSSRITIEEKLDGANLGISIAKSGELQAQNRGSYIHRDAGGQFKQLWRWIDVREDMLTGMLGVGLILFGEWCYAEHSVAYHELPDWLIGFDIFDLVEHKFYSVERRNALLTEMEIEPVPILGRGIYKMDDLKAFLERPSRFGADHLEGIYLREDQGDWLKSRVKLVRADFTQSIAEHWSSQSLKVNRVIYG